MDFVLCLLFSDTNVSRDSHIRELGLVFSPNNPVLEKLLKDITDKLNLDGVHGVSSSEEVERLMIEREFLAGVVFNHSAVKQFTI